jgi:hypothetical protein
MKRNAKLLFHSPCFDGIASAVLTIDYLQNREGWGPIDVSPVNYDVRATWLQSGFEQPTAIVDFLYHPDAAFWADHHRSSFLTPAARRDFERRDHSRLIYDAKADSCAGLLWRHFLNAATYRNERFAELVEWAEKIDAARYASVDEALALDHPALRISASLAFTSNGLSERLVHELSKHSLYEVSELPDVRERFLEFRRRMVEGMERLRAAAHLREGVIVFDVDASDVIVPRYGPYRFFPNALYSVGVVHSGDGAKVTAMRNPWIEFESVPLGDIFSRYGGGGHQRVASALVPADVDPTARLEEIVSAVAAAVAP